MIWIFGIDTLYLQSDAIIEKAEGMIREAVDRALDKEYTCFGTSRADEGVDAYVRSLKLPVVLLGTSEDVKEEDIVVSVRTHQPYTRLDEAEARAGKVLVLDVLTGKESWQV